MGIKKSSKYATLKDRTQQCIAGVLGIYLQAGAPLCGGGGAFVSGKKLL